MSVHDWPEEGIEFTGTRVTDGCEPLCGRWESNRAILQEHSALSTLSHLSSSTYTAFVMKNSHIYGSRENVV